MYISTHVIIKNRLCTMVSILNAKLIRLHNKNNYINIVVVYQLLGPQS